MSSYEQLYLILERNDPFPLVDSDKTISYFHKGCKVSKFMDGSFQVWDIRHSETKYQKMSEGQTSIFIKTYLEK